VNDLKDCFAAFDTDNDGLITKKDLALCIRAMGKWKTFNFNVISLTSIFCPKKTVVSVY
jgi:Ca2+-binding EF-hand superfamily protein